ncbi:LSU ribosomal protein L6p (L9e) [hydrothermal vent metagenome]|uniref:LSU ribosomal protein L6p (L9e) n=1 Tax=hydrothermal vent metagenome TaxID=652676 RepID=A0A3B1E420_9ZZZZ
MSRIGKIPVDVPKDVKANISVGNIEIQGKKGSLTLDIPYGISVKQKENQLLVERTSNNKQSMANHGTIRARLVNIITGVTQGHKKELEIQGIGFRAQLQGKKVTFNFGFSHPVEFESPDDVKITVPSQTSVIIEGIDNVRVGQIAAKIRSLKPVEPYKGKGVRYLGEVVRRKQGKSVSK